MEKDPNFKYIVRIMNTDLDGKKNIMSALRKIYGINFMFANLVCSLASIDKNKKVGYLTKQEIEKLNNVISKPEEAGAPTWMFNRRNDYETGIDKHMLTSDLRFNKEKDLKIMKMIKSYKGLRHAAGLTVRGQKTRSNFRKNKGKGSLGVKRKSKSKSGRV